MPEPTRPPLLQVRNLRIAASGAGGAQSLLVDDVGFDVPAGQVLGLIGESGAGKSTIGLAALGYPRPGCRIVGGTVTLDGAPVTASPQLRGAAITYVPQSAAASFNPAFRIVRQVCETALRRGLLDRAGAVRTASALFRRLGLNARDFGTRFPHQVSGGQLQRAATAMALCTSPRIVVFDEPTTALDVTVQVEVMRLIRESIRQAGLAALYISHDLAVVAQMADRIMVLRGGKTVEEGAVQAVITAPTADYTGRLVSVRLAAKQPAAQTGREVLAVDDIFAGYGAIDVVRSVSLRLTAGHTLAVVGESGSGKSSLARVLTGLLPPRQGTLTLGGRRLSARLRDRSRDDRRAMQLIHQNPDIALNPRQTVETILARPLTVFAGLSGAPLRARIVELLGQMELRPEFLQRRPGELSGGQKQRICIARALAAAPEVMICDEVTSALDPLVADGIVKLLMRIQRETGVALIVITHDIALVRAVADEVLVMQGGIAVERGPAAAILDRPAQAYTRTLIQSVPEMDVDWLTRLVAARAASTREGILQ